MWITSDVELPQAVVDAHTRGQLVFFVGAGASMAPPSDLPSFAQLAWDLAQLARVEFGSEDAKRLDAFLGSMPARFDTHAHARDLIARDGSQPNSTHAALVRLAASTGPLRIVTTNFDVHLSSAAAAEGIRIGEIWRGPALPLGDTFQGLVHLHGSVLQDPRELVLTDVDFGQAYLTRAWATRFLLSMFQAHTVVFVGYSHDDPIMRYLALGLPSGTLRYAFEAEERAGDPKWARLGIETIGYPVVGEDHGALVAALEAWGARAAMGQTDHQSRMKEIIKTGSTLTPVDRDYLTDRLTGVEGARDFVGAVAAVIPARQVEWLRWAEGLPQFRAVFAGKDLDDAASILSAWFCQTFIAVPELNGAALQTVLRLGQRFSSTLFDGACWAVEQLGEADGTAAQRWRALLASSIYGQSAPVETARVLPYYAREAPEHLSVLRAVLRPFLVLKQRWFLSEAEGSFAAPDAEVRWNADVESLTSHVARAVEAAEAGDQLLQSLLEDTLSAAYDLLAAYHGELTWDPLSLRRSAIEPHPQDQFRDPADAVIDGLRAYGEKARAALPDLPERWWSLDRGVFRRLALHLLAADASRGPDTKIEWLLERSLLYDVDLKHETYQVLEVAAERASSDVRARLLAAAQAGPVPRQDLPDVKRHTAYATYNLLVWLVRVAPSWSEAARALAEVHAENPDFAPREHPDLDMWVSGATWVSRSMIEPEDFAQAVEGDPAAALNDLLSWDFSERRFEDPSWEDALELVARLAESRPELGGRFWDVVEAGLGSADKADDLYRALIEGWAKADLGPVADAAVARVESQLGVVESARSISRFLLEQVRNQMESHDTPALDRMRAVAVKLWRGQRATFEHAGGDLMSLASLYLNSWPGDLALYWISEIDRRWRRHRDDWRGLSDEERRALTELLDGPSDTLAATRPALASELFFIFAADPQFTSERVLPLFAEDATAALVWYAYLHHPRYNDKLLSAGLLKAAIAEWDRLDALGSGSLTHQFLGLVASITSFAGITADSRQALLDQSTLAGDGLYAPAFADEVVALLRSDGVDGSEVWREWLRGHLATRLKGIPRIPADEELARWSDAVPYLGDAIPEALEMLSGREIGLGERFFAPAFPDGVLLEHGPALVQHYAERVRNSTPTFLLPHQVRELIARIDAVVGEAAAHPLVAAARELGLVAR